MKIDNWAKANTKHSIGLNTLSLVGVSLLWGHMLNLISIWFLPLTIMAIFGGYGSEVQDRKSNSLDRIEV